MVNIREIQEKDYRASEVITREAFWNIYKPGCDEHYIINNIRKSNNYIPELDLVAEVDGEIVGHIIATKASIVNEHNNSHEVLSVGPLCVVPHMQKKGIGLKLMNKLIHITKDLHYPGIILFGHPEYYQRFGYVDAKRYAVTTSEGENYPFFLALELKQNGLSKTKGCFVVDDVFMPNEEELALFDQSFTPKVKQVTSTQIK